LTPEGREADRRRMHRCRRARAVGIRLEPAAAIDENQDGTRGSNLIAPPASQLRT
jgi:hypothetical protein